ncbi:8847_t:CDS:2, partial [Paraglomus occultum]
MEKVEEAKHVWSQLPAPQRGEIVRQMRNALFAKREDLEDIGEVQEYIDMADYAVGLSRMFSGKILP